MIAIAMSSMVMRFRHRLLAQCLVGVFFGQALLFHQNGFGFLDFLDAGQLALDLAQPLCGLAPLASTSCAPS